MMLLFQSLEGVIALTFSPGLCMMVPLSFFMAPAILSPRVALRFWWWTRRLKRPRRRVVVVWVVWRVILGLGLGLGWWCVFELSLWRRTCSLGLFFVVVDMDGCWEGD